MMESVNFWKTVNTMWKIPFRILIAVFLLTTSLSLALTPPANAQEVICAFPDRHVSVPLTELGNENYIRMDGQSTSFKGGLYPNGENHPPAGHLAAALQIAGDIVPLDENGDPDPVSGQIVMISVGMSNTSHEFNPFIDLAHKDPQVNRRLRIVNGALGGQTAELWVDPQGRVWQEVNARLRHAKVTPEQVQIAWIKQTTTGGGSFPEKAQELQLDLELIAHNLLLNYPNIKIAYYSSRTRSFTYQRGLSPEPNAFESGFAVKWMIEKQIAGEAALNYDPEHGEVVAPLLLWGPYLWIDGGQTRNDGQVWTAEDLASDCTHPTEQGALKIAQMLLDFFKADETSRTWFLAGSDISQVETRAVLATPSVLSPAATTTRTQPPADTSTVISVPPTTAAPSATVAPSATAAPTATRLRFVPAAEVPPTITSAQPPVQPDVQASFPDRRIVFPVLAIVVLGIAGAWLWLRQK